MSCLFRATGLNFNVDDFLSHSCLVPDSIWCKGELRTGDKVHQTSGFSLVASEVGFDNLPKQVQDAIIFLKRNEQQIHKLQLFSGEVEMYLDFAIENRNAAAQYDQFPADLLRLAGNLKIGIEISLYSLQDRSLCEKEPP